MGLIFIFGRNLEILVGGKHLFMIYFISGIVGSISIIIYTPFINWEGLIAGASASTFGVTSAFAMIKPNEIVLKEKAKYWPIALFISNVALMIINPSVSIGGFAHIFGILIGIIYGRAIKKVV